jgi:N-acetylglucosaminyldiphosphoundecaprenol N-acetyl-beta-D-mannosaminyltransferase
LAPLAERAAKEQRSLYLLGGTPEANRGAAEKLRSRHPELRIVGCSTPRVSTPVAREELDAIAAELQQQPPDFLLVGLGSPKQEWLIDRLRPQLASTWMIGVGASFSFTAGEAHRAPQWMQRTGLEWAHRLAQEPGRLARRYLVEDAPFAVRLIGRSLASGAIARAKNKLR